MTGGERRSDVPPLGRCALCGLCRHLSAHRSVRDRLVRLLCTPCFSGATLAEESGHPVDWWQGRPAGGGEDDGLFPPVAAAP